MNSLLYLLYYNNLDIKILSAQELASITPLLTNEERAEFIEKQITNMSKADKVEQIFIVEVLLLGNLAEHYGQSKTENYIAPLILSQSESEFPSVKKETIKQITHISQFVSPTFFRAKLLPFFLLYS